MIVKSQQNRIKLVTRPVVQQLEQSTLDEVFTLLEPHMKQERTVGREMAVQTLRTTLKTFMDNYQFSLGKGSFFTPWTECKDF